MLCAVAGQPYRIPFGGPIQCQYARDVARGFIAASRAVDDGASVHDLPGRPTSMEEIVAAIIDASPGAVISFEPRPLPFPSVLDGASLQNVVGPLPETTLEDGVRETVARFHELLAHGQVAMPR
jgi:nucleoside-diphosphate-sugar epimerase